MVHNDPQFSLLRCKIDSYFLGVKLKKTCRFDVHVVICSCRLVLNVSKVPNASVARCTLTRLYSPAHHPPFAAIYVVDHVVECSHSLPFYFLFCFLVLGIHLQFSRYEMKHLFYEISYAYDYF